MPKLTTLWVWAFAGCLAFPVSGHPESLHQPDSPFQTQTYAFINGRWFTGQGFSAKTLYSVNGIFAQSQPDRIENTIDLKNGYVVPPFGEAHTHNVEGDWNIDRVIYHGVFDNLTLLKMWCENTLQAIFPSRKIGRFEEGMKPAFSSYDTILLRTSGMFGTLIFVLSKGFPF